MKNLAIGEIPKSAFDSLMKFPFIYWTLHGVIRGNDTSTQIKDRANAQTNGLDTELFTGGLSTVTNNDPTMWTDNVGWWTDDGTMSIQVSDDTELRNFFRMDNLSGGILIAFRFQHGASATAREYIIGYSGTDTTNGGFEVFFEVGAKVTVVWREKPNAGGTNILTTNSAPSTGAEHTCVIFMDTATGTPVMYIDGVINTTAANLVAPYPSLGTDFCLFARSVATPVNFINSQGTPARMVRDLLCVRATSDISGDIATIATQYHNNLGDLPQALTTA